MSEKKTSQTQKLIDTTGDETPAEPKKQPPAKKERTQEDKDHSFSFILSYVKRQCGAFAAGTVFLILGASGELAMPFFIGLALDLLMNNKFELLGTYCVYMTILLIVSGICIGFRAIIWVLLSERISRDLRKDFYDVLVQKDIAFFDENRTGDLISRLNSDIQVIQNTFGTSMSMFTRASLFLLVILSCLLSISPILTGMTMIGVAPLIAFSYCYKNVMRTLQREIQNQKGKMSTQAEETFANIRTVKSFSNEVTEVRRFNDVSYLVYEVGRKKTYYQALYIFATTILLYGAMALVMYTSCRLYQNDKLSIGDLATFLIYLTMFVFNFGVATGVFGNVAGVVGAADKVVAIMDHEPTINCYGGAKIRGKINGSLEVRNVKFAYPCKPGVEVLKGVSLSVDNEKNRVVALCGSSGCGKSSIISLIERFYDPNEGEILFNGRNIKELEPNWLHKQIAIVQQEPALFAGTIRENITFGLDVSMKTDTQVEAMIDDACIQSDAYDFIHDDELFPDAYETKVGERGVKLSGGQKQRVAIARALIRKPKILLLDEATSALDAESEHQVQQALDKLIKNGRQTVVVVAHRLSTIRDADEIIVMEQGEVVERGTHDDLLKIEKGFYHNLVSRQLVTEAAQQY